MNTASKTSRVLGIAFLLQFFTSLGSGTLLQNAWLVPGSITESMLKIAKTPWLLRLNILVDMLTALGIIFLGAILFITLRKQNEKMALVALGIYIVEAALLAVSRMSAFSLIRISQEFVTAGQPVYLQTMGLVALESMDFTGSTLHMLAFCIGGILFYILLDKARLVPRILSLWGLITVFPCLAATLLVAFGVQVPFYVFLPYVPFELVIGVWILVKGIREPQQARLSAT